MWKKTFSFFKPYWQLTVMIFLMTVVSGLCHQTSIMEWFRFWGFQIFCLLIPGMAVMILMPMKNLKLMEKVLYSYASGYMLTIVFYLFIMLTVGDKFLKAFFAIVAVAALVIVWRHVVRTNCGDATQKSDDRMWIWTILVVFLISLVVGSLRWRLPYIGERNDYHGDYLTWVRKITAFRRGASAFLPMLKSSPYHYLGMVQQAAAAKLTDISAFGMASQYSHIEGSIFLGLTSHALVNRFIRNKKAQIITLILILFSTGFEYKSIDTYIWHIYLVPMSYHIAQSLGVMVVLLVLIQLNEEFDLHKLLMTVALLVCCTGTKGATGAIIFGGITLACMYSFLVQKKKKAAMAYFISAFLGFGLVYLYLMPTAQLFSDTVETYLSSEEAGAADAVEITDDGFTEEGDMAQEETKSFFLCKGLNGIVGYVSHFLYINPWTMLPMMIFVCYSIFHRSIKKEYLILFVMTMAGTVIGYFIVLYGHSEMYFTLTVFPFAALLAGCLWDAVFLRKASSGLQTAIMVGLCSTVLLFSAYFDSGGEFRKCLAKGLDNLWIFHDNVIDNTEGIVLDYHEYYAYEWIRENTPPEALILTNRVRISEEAELFYSLTERDIIGMEGYLEEAEEFDQYSDMGVDYVVFNKYLGQFNCPPDKGEIIFENEQMIVCELY